MEYSVIKSVRREQIKDHIFTTLGITDRAAWAEKTIPEIMVQLRENAGWTLEEVGEKLGGITPKGGRGHESPSSYTRERIRQLENSGTPQGVERLLPILKLRLEELGRQGWLAPENLTVKDARYDEIASACRNLRMAQHLNPHQFDKAVKERGLEGFTSYFFEQSQKIHPVKNYQRTFANLLSVSDQLCRFYDCPTVEDLLTKAREAGQYLDLQTLPDYDPETKKDIGRAVGALLEFLGLGRDCLVQAGIFSHEPAVSGFVSGSIRYISSEKIRQMPDAITAAYETKIQGKQLPEVASFGRSVGYMTEKGLRLAALNKDYLRVALNRLMAEKDKTPNALANESGANYVTVWGFLKKKAGYANLSTHAISKMGEALGVPDIFALEAVGRPQLEKSSGPVVGKFSADDASRKSSPDRSEGR